MLRGVGKGFLTAMILTTMLVGGMNVSRAQNFERYKPLVLPPLSDTPTVPKKEEKPAAGSDQVLVACLDAIIVRDSIDKIVALDPFDTAEGISYDVDDTNSSIRSEAAQRILRNYIGQPITLRRLNELSRELIEFYKKCDQPVIDVVLPEQNISAGTLQIVVVESRVGNISVRACRTDPCWLRRQVRCTQPGDLLKESSLNEDLYWLNRSPFRRVELDMKPGSQKGTTDVFFKANEVRAWRSYVSYDDTGVRSLALERLTAGLIIGNMFQRDGTLSYQYNTDAYFRYLEAHAATFNYEFDRDSTILAYGSWAGVSPDLPPPFAQDGESWQVGLTHNRYFERTSRNERYWSCGAEFKSSNNNLEFGGTNFQTSGAELLQLNLGYDMLRRSKNGDYFHMGHDLYIGPGDDFTPRNTAAAFSTLRSATDPTYWYYRGQIDGRRELGNCWEANYRATGQAASERLLFSEMLGFGGNDTIRGFDSRLVSGDCGWITSLEVGPQAWDCDVRCHPTRLKLFAFTDLGQAFINERQAGEFSDLFMASVGVGMRWSLSNRATCRIDYGHALTDAPNQVTHDRLHISVVSFFGPTPK